VAFDGFERIRRGFRRPVEKTHSVTGIDGSRAPVERSADRLLRHRPRRAGDSPEEVSTILISYALYLSPHRARCTGSRFSRQPAACCFRVVVHDDGRLLGSLRDLCGPLVKVAEFVVKTDAKLRSLRVPIDIWSNHTVNSSPE
jgi:hypothetical protein